MFQNRITYLTQHYSVLTDISSGLFSIKIFGVLYIYQFFADGASVPQSIDTEFFIPYLSVVIVLGNTLITLHGPSLGGNSLWYDSVASRSAAEVMGSRWSKYTYYPAVNEDAVLQTIRSWSSIQRPGVDSIPLSTSFHIVALDMTVLLSMRAAI